MINVIIANNVQFFFVVESLLIIHLQLQRHTHVHPFTTLLYLYSFMHLNEIYLKMGGIIIKTINLIISNHTLLTHVQINNLDKNRRKFVL
uniref:Uncharacterized protein n=1 Tax=Gasterosteus aculeatus TaxID=69293 RepID=G3Q5Z2_GASAC